MALSATGRKLISLVFESADEQLILKVLAGRNDRHFFLALEVIDPAYTQTNGFNTATIDDGQEAGLVLYTQSARSQHSFLISSEAPGQLTLNSRSGTGKQLEAAWENTMAGYRVELSLPGDTERISIGAVAPVISGGGISAGRQAGTLNNGQVRDWLELVSRKSDIANWLTKTMPQQTRVWLLQVDGWVLADSGPEQALSSSELTWVQRMIYQAVADSRMPLRDDRPVWPVRFQTDAISNALRGGKGSLWNRDADSAAVYNLVAVPVLEDTSTPVEVTDAVIGAVVLETRSEGLLLMTNRALGRFSLIALLLVAVLTAGLWLFASRLSRRVQKLSGAVSRAMDETGDVSELPLTTSGDELGELARNTEKLLRSVAEYKNYLQKLAGRLSHELKTPIAITRSSLENLASHDLDPPALQYLSRAREGLDRQAAIVSAMSEAQRLEGSVRAADWEIIDVGEMLGHCVDAYRLVNPSRTITLNLPAAQCVLRCAPDLIAQAMDKLVDNAISLSARDSEIKISLKREGGDCLVSVANRGTRLPDVVPDQLFDSLVSLRENRESGKHLGLGLHIVRLVATAHGGKVSACNLPGDQGVEFTIRLPRRP